MQTPIGTTNHHQQPRRIAAGSETKIRLSSATIQQSLEDIVQISVDKILRGGGGDDIPARDIV